MNVDEKQLSDLIINQLKKQSLIGSDQNITVIYNAESKDVLYTVTEVAELIKSNQSYVYDLIKAGLLPALKLGSMKITRKDLLAFLDKYKGHDLADPYNIKVLDKRNE
ncbi:helix-turn-helix domain-containing protein [Alkaliphilus pronyensis]|uniref:Helix-turn-helix domain-containing protein n=2 Tax=Alkaliphilus pronyensis TaxID=1482732 RepID=A0A6I0F7U3_9FIRM|nr:helix-turn-helix domain-containing protein [Alkaliphilus pronyensis]